MGRTTSVPETASGSIFARRSAASMDVYSAPWTPAVTSSVGPSPAPLTTISGIRVTGVVTVCMTSRHTAPGRLWSPLSTVEYLVSDLAAALLPGRRAVALQPLSLVQRPDENFVDVYTPGLGDRVEDSGGDVFALERLHIANSSLVTRPRLLVGDVPGEFRCHYALILRGRAAEDRGELDDTLQDVVLVRLQVVVDVYLPSSVDGEHLPGNPVRVFGGEE